MYIRVAQASFDPSRLDEALAIMREHGLPHMRAAAGIGKLYVGVEREHGRITVVSTWDTLEHATTETGEETRVRLRARVAGLALQPGQLTICEVTDQF